MHAQWYIEKEYNIFIEIMLVAITWFASNSVMNYIWIFDKNILGLFLPSYYLPLNELRWVDFLALTIRSFACIVISSIYSIKESFKSDQMILIPPDERSIENFELVLHNPVAIDYFYEYLEEEELKE
jgi:hypothetical protein